MAGHPQNSARGLFAKQRVDLGTAEISFSGDNLTFENGIKVSNADGGLLTANSTGLDVPGNIRVGGISTAIIDGNSTGRIVLTNGVRISNKAGGDITANSTGVDLPGNVRVGGVSTAIIDGDSTGRIVLTNGLKLSNSLVLTANATAIIPSGVSALPGNLATGTLSIGSNSTGSWVAVRTTGTTWKYLNVTTALPT